MRNPWRLLLLRNVTRTSIHSSRIDSLHLQVRKLDPQSSRYFSSFIGRNVHAKSLFAFDSDIRTSKNRLFSSESAIERKDLDHDILTEIFSKSSSSEEIRDELKSFNILVNHEMVLTTLQNLEENPEGAWKLFNWVSETDSERLSSKSYNLMLGILGRKDHVTEFWDLFEIMKKNGYGISRTTYIKVSENFEKEKMVSDLDRLKEVYSSKSGDDPTATMCSRVCKVINEKEWDEEVLKRLRDLNISWSSDLVEMVLEHLSVHPTKALMFFWWVEENPSFKHTKQTYNAMVTVLGREDCIEKFWRIVDEMKGAGYVIEMETYVKVMGRFYKRRMVKDAVDLYGFMMGGSNKPPAQDALFLLRKIVVGKDLDMDLFSKVIGIFTEHGNRLTKPFLDGILKSLRSVSKLQECGKILKAMEKGGFVANNAVYSEIIFQLSRYGKLDEAYDILNDMEASGCNPNSKLWASLIQGQCEAGEIDTAASCFRKTVEKVGVTDASYGFDVLVNGFCSNNRAVDACKFLSEMVKEKKLQPWHTTYKLLIEKLLVRGNLEEALSLVGLMKNHGFPPFVDPFIAYISKSGTGDDAMSFLKAITVKRFPSTSVFIRMFNAFFKAGRHSEAHDCLSKCPGYIRSHADVLNLFFDMKPKNAKDATTALAA
ncbi:Pentatricopeptide repeat [Macleaya cordata]|uniref:Pentatricopeptide repeat n=1 Tax=Macleaya cordata TaxID=56857 RepID=A0A200RAJ4_MACCD|nr:Pentatricopeptide repeat [Macleaya cordata]